VGCFCNFEVTAQIKHSLIVRKFAQSGRPAHFLCRKCRKAGPFQSEHFGNNCRNPWCVRTEKIGTAGIEYGQRFIDLGNYLSMHFGYLLKWRKIISIRAQVCRYFVMKYLILSISRLLPT
jgi:hypothetical protein